jgi:ribosomal protein L9
MLTKGEMYMSSIKKRLEKLESVEFKQIWEDAESSTKLINELVELSEEAAKTLVLFGGMLNKDLAYDITKKIAEIKKLERKYG